MNRADPDTENLNSLSQVAARIERLQTFVPENAPGSFITAGIVHDMTCASCHASETGSWIRCVGEAVEYICQSRPAPSDLLSAGTERNWPDSLSDKVPTDEQGQGRSLSGYHYGSQKEVELPEVLFRGSGDAASIVMSSGCAAGPDPVSAALSGLCEILEHDTARKWWSGELSDRPVSDLSGIDAIANHIKTLRGPIDFRTTEVGLLDRRYGVHVVAAWSFDRANDDGFVAATAAHHDLQQAAYSCLHELMQLEWGFLNILDLSGRKTRALSDYETDVLRAAASTAVSDRRLSLTKYSGRLIEQIHPGSDNDTLLEELISSMDDEGLDIYGVTLHHQPGLTVIKSLISNMILSKPVFS